MNEYLISNQRKTFAYKSMVIFIGLYLALTPFDYIRNLGIYSHITKILILVIILFFVINNITEIKIEHKNKRNSIKIEKITLVFFGYMFFTMIISDYEFDKTQEMILLLLQNLVFVFIILSKTIEKEDIKKIENIWLVVMGLFSIFIAIFNVYIIDRSALKFFDGLIDPNIYSASLIVPFLIGLKKIINKERKKILIAIVLINMSFSILLSGSRGSLMAIILATFIYLFLYSKKQHKFTKVFEIFLIVIAILTFIIPFVPETTTERFSIEGMLSDGGAGRTSIWKTAIEYFENSEIDKKLLGNGIGTFRYNAGNQVLFEKIGSINNNVYSHNIFFTILIEGGIIGFTIMCLLLKNIWRLSYRIENKVPFCAFIGILIASMFVDMIYLRIFWSVIGYAIIYIKSYDMGEKDERESKCSNTSI